MPHLIIKALLAALAVIFMSKEYINWLNIKRECRFGMAQILLSAVFIGIIIYTGVFRTEIAQFLLIFSLIMLLFLFRRK